MDKELNILIDEVEDWLKFMQQVGTKEGWASGWFCSPYEREEATDG